MSTVNCRLATGELVPITRGSSGPVSTWMGDRLRAGISSRYVTSQLGQLSLASLQGRLIEYQLRLGVKAGMPPLPGGR